MDSNRRRNGTIVDLIPVNTPLAQFPAALDSSYGVWAIRTVWKLSTPARSNLSCTRLLNCWTVSGVIDNRRKSHPTTYAFQGS